MTLNRTRKELKWGYKILTLYRVVTLNRTRKELK